MAPGQRQRQLFYIKKDQKKNNGKKATKYVTINKNPIIVVYQKLTKW